ncbi:MAG: cobyrinate a,c-diamide synthase [Firmicutes bacterium]|nr:cobyrinate a,c-diamide synthase [Bacillota bacterium]
MNRVLLAAPKSGSGKTFITCGVIQALVNKKMKVSAFKCGPDYIDPMFHAKVLGAKTGNLDTYFCDENTVNYILKEGSKNCDIAVIEGVMGYYDGIGGIDTMASTYDVARKTKTPVILIVDCRGMSNSIVPVIKGFMEYKNDSMILGVILNKTTYSAFKRLKPVIEDNLKIKVFGYIQDMKEYALESRHLGLIMPHEIINIKEKIDALAKRLIETVDINSIIELAKTAEKIDAQPPQIPKLDKKVRIGVAMDNVFCFYYKENLTLIEKMGAEIVPFSPLMDREIPDGLDGIMFGGGYPELYSKELFRNSHMMNSVKRALSGGIPFVAECGGFMYITSKLESARGINYDMVGFIEGHCYKMEQLNRFGYAEITINKPSVFGEKGVSFKGHEFHYWDSTNNGEDAIAVKPLSQKSWKCVHTDENMYAGFPHLYFYSNIEAVYNFLKKCGEKSAK